MFSLGGSKSDSNNESNFNQNVFGGPSFEQMYGSMGNLFGQSNQGMQGQIPGSVNQMQGIFDQSNPAWQNQLEGGAYSGMDLQGQYDQDRQGGGNEQWLNQSIMGGQGNGYADAMRGQLQQDSDRRLGSSLAMNDARAAGNQLSGSSRHGLTEGRLYDDANRDLTQAQTQVGYGSFDKDLERKMGIAQRADQFDMQRLQQSGQMLGNQNAAMQGGLNFGQNMQNMNMGQFAPWMAPWQAAGQYANNMGNPTVLGSGSSEGSSDSGGFGFGLG
jgi:hypothetical protein